MYTTIDAAPKWKSYVLLPVVLLLTLLLVVYNNSIQTDSLRRYPYLTSTNNLLLRKDKIVHLPGYGVPEELQYSGLVNVNDGGGNIFYWFFETRRRDKSKDTPIILWLNGGPGASSMTGAFTEMGPYRMLSNQSLSKHEYSWTNIGHMIFFDQPAGTGYTWSSSEKGYVNSQREMAMQMYVAMDAFYDLHEEYEGNPLYVCGESYAGKYVPYFAHYIHEKEKDGKRFNLKGIAVGNGLMWPVLQAQSVPDYAMALGLIDQKQYDFSMARLDVCAQLHAQGNHVQAFGVCQQVEDHIYQKDAGNPFIYDIRKKGNPFDALTLALSAYFNSEEVRSALHVPSGTRWKSIDGSSYGTSANAPSLVKHLVGDEILDVPNQILKDLIENYRFMFYAGNMDGSSCNNLGITRVIDRLVWSGSDAFQSSTRKVWTVNGDVQGLVKHSDAFYFVIVVNSGHLVPTDQPEAALRMMDNFVHSSPF